MLQLSDLHMTAGQRSKQEWVAGLAALEPDLVINTGDNLAGFDAVPGHAAGAGPADGPARARSCWPATTTTRRGRRTRSSTSGPTTSGCTATELPWRDLRDGMLARGWLDLTNAAGELTVGGRRIVFAGVDDSHLKRDRYDEVAGPADPAADVRIGLAHSPEPRVLDRFAADGYDLLLCGHTHGGQLRVPFYGALVTNCGIDRDRVRWLHRWAEPSPGDPPAPGCTSRPGWAPARTRRSASPARRRPRCSR